MNIGEDFMNKKRDHAVSILATGLTETQASNLISEVGKAKNKIAPNAKVIAAAGKKEKISSLLGGNRKSLGYVDE